MALIERIIVLVAHLAHSFCFRGQGCWCYSSSGCFYLGSGDFSSFLLDLVGLLLILLVSCLSSCVSLILGLLSLLCVFISSLSSLFLCCISSCLGVGEGLLAVILGLLSLGIHGFLGCISGTGASAGTSLRLSLGSSSLCGISSLLLSGLFASFSLGLSTILGLLFSCLSCGFNFIVSLLGSLFFVSVGLFSIGLLLCLVSILLLSILGSLALLSGLDVGFGLLGLFLFLSSLLLLFLLSLLFLLFSFLLLLVKGASSVLGISLRLGSSFASILFSGFGLDFIGSLLGLCLLLGLSLGLLFLLPFKLLAVSSISLFLFSLGSDLLCGGLELLDLLLLFLVFLFSLVFLLLDFILGLLRLLFVLGVFVLLSLFESSLILLQLLTRASLGQAVAAAGLLGIFGIFASLGNARCVFDLLHVIASDTQGGKAIIGLKDNRVVIGSWQKFAVSTTSRAGRSSRGTGKTRTSGHRGGLTNLGERRESSLSSIQCLGSSNGLDGVNAISVKAITRKAEVC